MSTSLWNKRFIDLADFISLWSKDNIKVGCIIVDQNKKIVGTGYNGMPSWFDDNKLFELGVNKNKLITHAEINALKNMGNKYPEGPLTLYVNRPPCFKCAKKICFETDLNISNIFYTNKTNKEHQKSLDIFKDFGIELTCMS